MKKNLVLMNLIINTKKSDMYYLDGYWQNINFFNQESEYFKKIFKVKKFI